MFSGTPSIRQKILAMALATALLTGILSLSFFLVTDFHQQRQTLLEQSKLLSRILASNVAAAVIYHDPATATEVLAALKEKSDVISAHVFTPDRQVFAEYRSRLSQHMALLAEIDQGISAGSHTVDTLSSDDATYRFNDDCLAVVVPIRLDSRWVGFIDLHLSLAETSEHFRRTVHEAVSGLAIAILFSVLLARWLGRRVSRPLQRLTRSIEQVSRNHSFNTRLNTDSRDETGVLIHSFNNMLDRLEQQEHNKNALIVKLSHAKWEAERASRAKSEFLSRMSHELRTPLHAIIGFGQLLESDPEHPLSEEQHDSVRHILNSGNHLLALISELLDLATVESGKLNLVPGPIECRSLVEETVRLVTPQVHQAGLQIGISGGEALPPASADRLRLKQCLLNLLSNAMKYNRADGTIQVSIFMAETKVAIAVEDSGRGIAAENMPLLFQPFTRFHLEQETIEGTGIGLLITKHMVELMNGELLVDSRPGVGSRFTILLPVASTDADQSEPGVYTGYGVTPESSQG
ncbi:ATP-binding protein [Methylomonas sp. MS20]|uniref:ATP-binding protein n=2 Tax=Methylomonas TaxID=416 RepID=UPI0028A3CF94|nr:ATP-binding protein [Methylomonas sp. MV1]MDT4330452.1 ATP-binding protein [Methylomonas sp. MV1]